MILMIIIFSIDNLKLSSIDEGVGLSAPFWIKLFWRGQVNAMGWLAREEESGTFAERICNGVEENGDE